ncbi:peptidoglycan D,D-transpeptidase FtsI family protein [Pontibacillus salicampi]|uniref:Peptidoglycan D,D-transpeptidase FtsI family protein n=1 Tax=Pontibacillus salicampi TaxID=1449801 RepID=A0ABV6LJE2_9BACI
MKKRRAIVIACIVFIGFSVLFTRLAIIQLWKTESFGLSNINLLEASVAQRSEQITISDGRGTMVDRNNIPISHPTAQDVVFFPFLKDIDFPSGEIASVLSIDEYSLQSYLQNAEQPFYITDMIDQELTEEAFKRIQDMRYPGVYAVQRQLTDDPVSASHFIGLVREQASEQEIQKMGLSGIQKAFEPFLEPEGDEKLIYHVDGHGEPMFGLNVKYQGLQDAFYPVQLKTTIHMPFQEEAEAVMDEHQISKGAVIILDVQSRDVLTMVSRPAIDYTNPYKNIDDPHDDTLHNYALKATMPGSIFKTLITSAALEHPTINVYRQYDCDIGINGREASRELGMLSFEESFARSCNNTFVELAKEMMEKNPAILDHYAAKLGLNETVGWEGNLYHFQDFEQFPEEETNKMWASEEHKKDDNMIAHTAIGQQNVRWTPLSVVNMMATIADDGIKKQVRGVSRILYQNGATMKVFEEQLDNDNRISAYNALKLKELLYQVTEHPQGTGKALKGLEVAGKSGTAEDDGASNDYHWFAGFFPYEQPRYAMVVLDLQSTSQIPTYNVFRDMVEFIYANDQTF